MVKRRFDVFVCGWPPSLTRLASYFIFAVKVELNQRTGFTEISRHFFFFGNFLLCLFPSFFFFLACSVHSGLLIRFVFENRCCRPLGLQHETALFEPNTHDSPSCSQRHYIPSIISNNPSIETKNVLCGFLCHRFFFFCLSTFQLSTTLAEAAEEFHFNVSRRASV